jgi:hypothetical protein
MSKLSCLDGIDRQDHFEQQSGKAALRDRRRMAETVVRTHIAVFTGPRDNPDPLSLTHELDLIKASVLLCQRGRSA